jgi:hypothetical protein
MWSWQLGRHKYCVIGWPILADSTTRSSAHADRPVLALEGQDLRVQIVLQLHSLEEDLDLLFLSSTQETKVERLAFLRSIG